MKQITAQPMQLNSTVLNRAKELCNKKQLTDAEQNEFYGIFANLSTGKDIYDLYYQMESKITTQVAKANDAIELKINKTTINIAPATVVTTSWDADAIRKDAEAVVPKISCLPDYEKYFKQPSLAINPHTCAAAGDEFKQKYGKDKTTISATVQITK